ncbi:16S rRNA pseudouridine(516) synthase RsuA [Vibrio cincinnatiensis]|uniref:16S rRNA pseudouridine(516) synthase RsuA n=1 Tax=Vibrio cincinnatiensis TaxID=675 RepID=UPI001EDCB01C|nr:16S rRNA pseudouridine(516) synthase RsuA [Vibrio cincinnatiensis]MCG3726648.1 16S rRNA pseudouridine(516) synthase RsuA [Vibrio cincinnatiensis]
MRLDKFLCDALGTTRKESTSLLKSGEVTVDDIVQKSGSFKVKSDACVEWQGRSICLTGPRYIMLHKPQGYVCSHEDSFNQTAFVLLDEVNLRDLHFAGRLDADTTGLVLITDDGQWSHRITSPKHHCEKTYRVWLADPVEPHYAEQFALGIELRSERELTRPAQLEIIDETQVLLTIHEGKYHQVKRMFAALGNKVIGLHRERVGEIVLDETLEPGEYRRLTEQEIASVWK